MKNKSNINKENKSFSKKLIEILINHNYSY